jgi:tetratricopeptide (TPR) repeat protein
MLPLLQLFTLWSKAKSVPRVSVYLGQYDKAIEEQRKTLELNPGFYRALVNLGEVYEAKGDVCRRDRCI